MLRRYNKCMPRLTHGVTAPQVLQVGAGTSPRINWLMLSTPWLDIVNCCNPPGYPVNPACPFSCYEIQETATEHLGSLQNKQPLNMGVSSYTCSSSDLWPISGSSSTSCRDLSPGFAGCAMSQDHMGPVDSKVSQAMCWLLSEQFRENHHHQRNRIITYPFCKKYLL